MIILYAKYRHFVNVICSFFQRVKYNILFSALHSFLHSPTARPSMRTSFMASAMRIMEGKAGFSARSSIWSANRKTRFRVASPSIRTAATFWVCNPARKVVQYNCRVDCIHFCGQADLWKRSRCANTGGVFILFGLYLATKYGFGFIKIRMISTIQPMPSKPKVSRYSTPMPIRPS